MTTKPAVQRDKTTSSQAYLTALMDSSDDAIIITTPKAIITRWNAAAEKLFGYAADEMVQRPLSLIIPQKTAKELAVAMKQAGHGKRKRHFETTLVGKTKHQVDVSLSICPLKSNTANITSVLIIARDVSRRKRGVAERLQRNRELLTLHRLSETVLSSRSFEESCHDTVGEICNATGFPIAAIALYDEARQMVVWHGLRNHPAPPRYSVSEAPIDETLSGVVIRSGKPLVENHLLDHPEYTSRVMRWARANTFIGYPMKVGRTIIGCLNLAHTKSVEISPETAQWVESLANYVAVLTERKRAEDEILRSREQLRELSRQVQSRVEEERKSIARELHDQLGQELSLLQLELGLLRDQLPRAARDLRVQATSMAKMIDSAIRSTQRISTELRPTILDNLGLGPAAEWVTRQFQKRTGIHCRISIDPHEFSLDPERSTALFRILQEALTNVFRHAKATQVEVRLEKQKGSVVMKVRDNGAGIPRPRVTDPKSVGLTGMRERVHPWGGRVVISGIPARGTEVVATIPLSP